MKHNARTSRLRIEQEKLINLAKRSEFIKVQEVDVQPGWPPEKYVVTFTCRGIAGIDDATKVPQSSEFHQVSIYLSRDFPRQEPYLKWLTPIWHPNIEHEEPHHVCTNNVQNWYAGKSLDDLVLALGEMVQYKRYHAVWVQPWPLDKKAADWVVEYAEPKGIVGPNAPYDDRPLLRSYEIRLWKGDGDAAAAAPAPDAASPKRTAKLKIGVKKMTGELKPPPTSEPPVVRRKGLTLGEAAKKVICPTCGKENRLRQAEGVAREFFCGNCKARLTSLVNGDAGSPRSAAHGE